jgi:hypothetical protein
MFSLAAIFATIFKNLFVRKLVAKQSADSAKAVKSFSAGVFAVDYDYVSFLFVNQF